MSVRSGSQGSEGSTELNKTNRQEQPVAGSANFVQRKLQQYGIHNKVNHHLLNQNETEFRYILREIVEDYPQTKPQRMENIISDCNITNLNQLILTSQRVQPIISMNQSRSSFNKISLNDIQEQTMKNQVMSRTTKSRNAHAAMTRPNLASSEHLEEVNKLYMTATPEKSKQIKTVDIDVSSLNTSKLRPKSKADGNRINISKVYMNSKIDNVFNQGATQIFQPNQNPYVVQFNRTHHKTLNEGQKMIPFFANRKNINTSSQFKMLYQPQFKTLKIAQTLRNKSGTEHGLRQLHLTNKGLLPKRLDSRNETRYSSLPRQNYMISGGSATMNSWLQIK